MHIFTYTKDDLVVVFKILRKSAVRKGLLLSFVWTNCFLYGMSSKHDTDTSNKEPGWRKDVTVMLVT